MALIRGIPGALKIAFKDHVHGLKHQAALIARHINNALGAQDVGALAGQDVIEPVGDLAAVQWPVQPQGYAANIIIMNV